MKKSLTCLLLLSLNMCGEGASNPSMTNPGEYTGRPGAPSDAAPTGSKWEGNEVEDECGRTSVEWTLVDEVCGGTDDPNYLDYFRVSMLRDGARIGEHLFSVDGTHLWVLDVSDPNAPMRVSLLSGLGHPVAAAAYGEKLLIAAGEAGLLVLDVTDALEPQREHTLELTGTALDVYVDEDTQRAFVALGDSGVAVVDMSGSAPALEAQVPVTGFAAAVAAHGDRIYVAACDTFSIIDFTTGEQEGSVWLETDPVTEPIPSAKDVEIVGDIAFVAAGRYGAVMVDLSDLEQPTIAGMCAVDDPLFYASGVRAQDGRLFVAGGEWGILPVDLDGPMSACSDGYSPTLWLPPEEEECSTVPPWEVLDWTIAWSPQPPPLPGAPIAGRDPVQTLPDGDVVYAFGDATRIGLRAIDVRLAKSETLEKVGRYSEPRWVEGVAARDGRVLVVGERGGIFAAGETELLVRASDVTIPDIERSVSGTLLDDGRWAIGTHEGNVWIENIEGGWSVSDQLFANSVASKGNELAVPTDQGVWLMDATTRQTRVLSSPLEAVLPPAIAMSEAGVVLAAPEWASSLTLSAGGALVEEPHGVFDEEQVRDVHRWRLGLPRRFLLPTSRGLIEIASLGREAGVMVHGVGTADLPPATYVAATAVGDWLYLVSADRTFYRSQVVTLSISDAGLTLVETQSFTGVATGVSADGDRLYVSDADRGVRVYGRDAGLPVTLGVVELGTAAEGNGP